MGPLNGIFEFNGISILVHLELFLYSSYGCLLTKKYFVYYLLSDISYILAYIYMYAVRKIHIR